LASSSSGNTTFIGTEKTRILIDAGLSRRETFERLQDIGEDPQRLDAVVVSHEHTDHVGGLGPILRRLDIPVYMSRLAAPAIAWGDMEPKLQMFQAGESFTVGDLRIETFTIPHDSIDPVGFCVCAGAFRLGLVTDLGYLPGSVKFHLMGTDFLILESNHDIDMLKVGPYPWSVKQRVMGRNGHLSNDFVSDFILEGMDGCLRTLVLGHLSEQNNHPEIARLCALQAMQKRSMPAELVVVDPKKPSAVFQIH
jgi:phosphoribosyl 1,2-cyclic phosphodiesterase